MQSVSKYRMVDLISSISMGPFGSNIKTDCFVDSGVPVLNGSNLQGFKLNEDSFKYVSLEKADSLGKANAYRGDVVVTHRGTLGQIVYIPNDSRFERYVISQSQFRFVCNEKVLPEYITYYFHSKVGQHKLLANASQVGVPALARATSTFKEIEVEIPPVSIQKQIVKILSSLDSKIEINNRINGCLLEQCKSFFENWFVTYRRFGGKAPNDWNLKKLGDVFEVKRGGSPRPIQDYLSTEGYRWLKISDATSCDSPYLSRIAEHIKEEGLKKTVFLHAGNIVLSNSATPGLPKILDVDTCIHDGWLYFPQSDLSKEFMYLLFEYLRPHLLQLGNGSIFTNLKTEILKAYEFRLPGKDVLEVFDQSIAPLFEEIHSMTKENLRLETLHKPPFTSLESTE